MREEYDRVNSGGSRPRKASDSLKNIPIGKEDGLEQGGIACEQGNLCYMKFIFYTNSLLRKGVRFF